MDNKTRILWMISVLAELTPDIIRADNDLLDEIEESIRKWKDE